MNFNIDKYYRLIKFFIKYGPAGLSSNIESEFNVSIDEHKEGPSGDNSLIDLAKDIQDLGPTFVKLGQLLSTQSDYIPPKFRKELEKLQDDTDAVEFSEIADVIYHELGEKADDLFKGVDLQPLASASLAQVHRATLKDGQEVVVKVQRPGIRKQMLEDFEVLENVSIILDKYYGKNYNFRENLLQVKKHLMLELNYEHEAENLNNFHKLFSKYENLIVPRYNEKLTTSKVIVMEYIEGVSLSQVNDFLNEKYNVEELADNLLLAYLEQILNVGLVHADPHPGNLKLTSEGKIALIDFGMIMRVPIMMREKLAKLILALAEKRSKDAAKISSTIGIKQDDFDYDSYLIKIDELISANTDYHKIKAGQVVLDIAAVADECNLLLPSQFIMLGKTLVKLDKVCDILNPDMDPSELIKDNYHSFVKMDALEKNSISWIYEVLSDSRELVADLPYNFSEILKQFSSGRFNIVVDVKNERNFIQSLQKIANRISNGIVIASLIIGAALMLDIQTSFLILGYPGIAIIFFTIAFILGVYSVVTSMIKDK